MKTKIVQILESTATGTLSMVATISNLLIDHGYEVSVIYSKRDETPQNLPDYFNDSVQLIHFDMTTSANVPLISYKLNRLIKELNPNIVHLHSSKAGFIGRIAVMRMKHLKVLYSPHCISFMMKDLPAYKKHSYVLLERIANKLSGEYVACSESERTVIQQNIKSATVHKIDNAVDLITNNKLATIFSNETIKIITVGQIRPQKNPQLFASIAKRIIAHQNNVEFIWAGDGDADLKETLISAGVTVTGWQTKNEIVDLLSGSDLYLSTSDWEGLPVSVLEAMQFGLPLIVSNCYGNIDLVENKINGLIFNDEEEAIEVIEQCLRSKDFCLSLSKNSLKLAAEQFSIERFNDKYLSLYQPAT